MTARTMKRFLPSSIERISTTDYGTHTFTYLSKSECILEVVRQLLILLKILLKNLKLTSYRAKLRNTFRFDLCESCKPRALKPLYGYE